MTVMAPADRQACELYLKDLKTEFEANQTALWAARDAGNTDEYQARTDESRRLHCEMRGVVTALRRGALPPYSDSEIKRGEVLEAWRGAVHRKHHQAAAAEITRSQAEVETRIDAAISTGDLIDVEWQLICETQDSASEVPSA